MFYTPMFTRGGDITFNTLDILSSVVQVSYSKLTAPALADVHRFNKSFSNVNTLLDWCPQNFSCGAVPYLGTYLTVLTMLDTALTDAVEVSTHHNPQTHLLFLLVVFVTLVVLYLFHREDLLTLRSADG